MKPGEVYLIRNTTPTLGGRLIGEGHARLIKRLGEEDPEREHWRVRFLLESGVYDRWVNAADRISEELP